MKILVTGGAGFIGSHICELLVGAGHDVRVLDNFTSGKRENLDSLPVEIFEGDLIDPSFVDRAVRGMNAIAHLAAFVSVPESVKSPRDCIAVNVAGTENLLKAAEESKLSRIVFASTCAVYGDSPGFPKKENSVCNPLSPYAESKLHAERKIQKWSLETGKSFTILRLFNVFGPRQSPDSQYAGVVARFLDRAKKGQPLVIEGDGKSSRDFVFVGDVAEIFLQSLEGALTNGVFHVASGHETSVQQLADMILECTQSSSDIEYAPGRTNDVRRSSGDISKGLSLGMKQPGSLRLRLDTWIRDESCCQL